MEVGSLPWLLGKTAKPVSPAEKPAFPSRPFLPLAVCVSLEPPRAPGLFRLQGPSSAAVYFVCFCICYSVGAQEKNTLNGSFIKKKKNPQDIKFPSL